MCIAFVLLYFFLYYTVGFRWALGVKIWSALLKGIQMYSPVHASEKILTMKV